MTVYDISIPEPEEKEGRRGYTTLPYLRFAGTPYQLFQWSEQSVWRQIVDGQPIATLCRETITERISTIDWRIEPVDTTKRQELASEIKHYTRLFEQNNGYDLTAFNEWVLGDALDLPFGSGVELIYRGDDPNKQLVDFTLLDGATLFPTNNAEYPVVQWVSGAPISDAVAFPKHAINRFYYSPRRDIRWRGWGVAPPEKIYMALQMLVQGDKYYWKLLIDTPEAGILDLLDMEKESAEEWLESMRALLEGIDPLKVPVLYEHTKEAKFIPFGRPPSEILYDSTTLKYAAITCAGYGLSLSDIGVSSSANGGETLSGTIRQERNTNRKGVGFAKEKMRLFRNRMLPKSLHWVWVDPDEEQQVARGRALMSTATAIGQLISNRVISPSEGRQIVIGAGLPSVELTEEIPEEDMKQFDMLNPALSAPKRDNMLGTPVSPSTGGTGEVRASLADKIIEEGLQQFVNSVLTPASIEESEEEYLEMLPLMANYLNENELVPALEEFFADQYEQTRSKKSWFAKERYRSFAKVEDRVRAEIHASLKAYPLKVAEIMLHAKSHALDNSGEVLDNFIGYQIDVVNQLMEALATDLGKRLQNVF